MGNKILTAVIALVALFIGAGIGAAGATAPTTAATPRPAVTVTAKPVVRTKTVTKTETVVKKATPSGMKATLATWQAYGPPEMRARFTPDNEEEEN